jgi:tetratricopeptide (TPR) repeat protein
LNKWCAIVLGSVIACSFAFAPSAQAGHFSKKGPKGENTTDPAKQNFEVGKRALKAKDYDTAIDAFLQSLYFARNNYNPEALFFLGLCYKAKHQDEKAIDCFKKHLTETTERSVDAHMELAELYMRNDNEAECSKELVEASRECREPNPRIPYINAVLLERSGDKYLFDAQQLYLTALGDKPWTYTDAWVGLAENNMKQKLWRSALHNLSDIIKDQGRLQELDLERVYLDSGHCWLQVGNHQAAMDSWKKACALNPDSALGHVNLGRLFDMEQHVSSAITEYRNYLRVAPKAADAQQVKDRLAWLEQQIRPAEDEPLPAGTPTRASQLEDEQEKQRTKQLMEKGSGF